MEIGVHVVAEDSFRGDTRHVVSAYFTFVALDKNGSPTNVPPLLPETASERRRFDDAAERRNARLAARIPAAAQADIRGAQGETVQLPQNSRG
jgi:acyl-CoA hydrolase